MVNEQENGKICASSSTFKTEGMNGGGKHNSDVNFLSGNVPREIFIIPKYCRANLIARRTEFSIFHALCKGR